MRSRENGDTQDLIPKHLRTRMRSPREIGEHTAKERTDSPNDRRHRHPYRTHYHEPRRKNDDDREAMRATESFRPGTTDTPTLTNAAAIKKNPTFVPTR